MKTSCITLTVFCAIALLALTAFADWGPCDTPSPIEMMWQDYGLFPNPGGSHLPPMTFVTASHDHRIYADGSCLNANEFPCDYTYNLPRASGTSTFYTYTLVNGTYTVTAVVVLPLIPVRDRRGC